MAAKSKLSMKISVKINLRSSTYTLLYNYIFTGKCCCHHSK